MIHQPPTISPADHLISGINHLNNIKSKVFIDVSTGIILPDFKGKTHKKKLLDKIRYSLEEIRQEIAKAREQGKHMLLLPGSFDLVHSGHVTYVEKSIASYCQQAKCKRSELFVVLLADDDDLISHVKSYKHVDHGGTEPERRPVETAPERLVSLASIEGVDIVGTIPSPVTSRKKLPRPVEFPIKDFVSELMNEYSDAANSRIEAMKLAKDIEKKYKLQLKDDIEEIRTGLIYYDFMQKNWDTDLVMHYPVQAWQLYIMSTLNSVGTEGQTEVLPFARKEMTRFVNTEDTKYINQVLYLMNKAKIAVALFEYKLPEKSTSETISWAIAKHEQMSVDEKVSPWEIIKEHKKQSFNQRAYAAYLECVSEIRSNLGI